jgi:transcriptional regulator with XRE-family HTH domain
MAYGGKVLEQQRARELRAQAWTLADIAAELCVSKSSVSLWVRDVEFVPNPRRRTRPPRVSSLHLRKLEEISSLDAAAVAVVGQMSAREFLMAGIALYAGEGSKTDGAIKFANTNPALVAFFLAWLRRFFVVEESRLRVNLYLHEGLDIEAAVEYWSLLTRVPASQFGKPYRAVADPTIRRSKHVMGCPAVVYCSTSAHRRVMGLVRALSCPTALPG